jgi:cap1 methyltransferase
MINFFRENPLFYFVDVCGGPGGFSEYMLWRKAFYNAKGFGITSAGMVQQIKKKDKQPNEYFLLGKEDFKLGKFQAASPEYFEPYYGVKENGNVMDPDNLESLQRFVHERIHGPNKGKP